MDESLLTGSQGLDRSSRSWGQSLSHHPNEFRFLRHSTLKELVLDPFDNTES